MRIVGWLATPSSMSIGTRVVCTECRVRAAPAQPSSGTALVPAGSADCPVANCAPRADSAPSAAVSARCLPRGRGSSGSAKCVGATGRTVGVVVSVELVGEGTPSPFELPGKSLDELLWKVGRAAFPERLAPWLAEGDGYWLTRWPNWTMLHPDTDHIRQTAMLANTLLTIEQLAALSGRGVESTRTLVNALSLMGVLGVAAADTLDARVAPEPLGEASLFQRLRRRFRMT